MSDSGHIFISYARRDGRDLAERLYQALTVRGIRAWRDERDLNPYQDFSVAIERAIRAARQVVVLLTPEIAEREDSFVRREIMEAQAREKLIIPLLGPDFDAKDVPVHIKHLTWLPFTAFDDHLPGLLERLDNPPEGYTPPSLPHDPFREYVQQLRDFVNSELEVSLLNIHDLILLQAKDTPDAVPSSAPAPLPAAFKSRAFRANEIEPAPPLERDFDNFNEGFAAHEGRVLLLGEPGAGKTTTLLAFTRQKAIDRLTHPANPLPVYAPLASWDSKGDLVEWLVQATGLDSAALRTEIVANRALLVLDGLDEMAANWSDPKKPNEPSRDFRLELLETLKPLTTSVLVSCRIKDYDKIVEKRGAKIALNGAITLQPLSDEQIEAYLLDQPELYDALQFDDALLDMARTPLLLTLLAIGYRDSTPEERAQLRDLSHSPGDLRDKIFATYVKKRYEHEQTRSLEPLPYTLGEMDEKLGRAAVSAVSDILRDNSGLIAEQDFKEADQYALVKFAIQLSLLRPAGMHYTFNLGDLGDLEGLFAGQKKQQHWQFQHTLLRDYFWFRQAIADLSDPNVEFRLHAIWALEWTHDSRCVEALINALADTDFSIRKNAARKLGAIRDKRAVKPLIDTLGVADLAVRSEVAYALGELGDKRAVEPLIDALDETDVAVRCGAAHALGELRDERATTSLIFLLSDNRWDFDVRVCDVAVYALENIGTPEALDAVAQWRLAQKNIDES